jgi:hypothetical protein
MVKLPEYVSNLFSGRSKGIPDDRIDENLEYLEDMGMLDKEKNKDPRPEYDKEHHSDFMGFGGVCGVFGIMYGFSKYSDMLVGKLSLVDPFIAIPASAITVISLPFVGIYVGMKIGDITYRLTHKNSPKGYIFDIP